IHYCVWKSEVSLIKQVEELRTEIQRKLLGDAKCPRDSQVEIDQSWTEENIRRGISEQEWSGYCESARIEPALRSPLIPGQVSIANPVGTDASCGVRRIAVD